MQNPAWRNVLAGQAIEARPVEPVSLAPAQQGMPPSAADLAPEGVQSQQVSRNCMVRKVAIPDPLKPCADDRHRFMPSLVKLFADRRQRCSHTLLARQTHDLELPVTVRPATVREPQKVERLRPCPRSHRRSAAKRPNSIRRVLSGCKVSANFANRSRRSSRNARAVRTFSKSRHCHRLTAPR